MPGHHERGALLQRKAGPRGRHSHRDLYSCADGRACPFNAGRRYWRVHFLGLAAAPFPCSSGRAQKGNERDD